MVQQHNPKGRGVALCGTLQQQQESLFTCEYQSYIWRFPRVGSLYRCVWDAPLLTLQAGSQAGLEGKKEWKYGIEGVCSVTSSSIEFQLEQKKNVVNLESESSIL